MQTLFNNNIQERVRKSIKRSVCVSAQKNVNVPASKKLIVKFNDSNIGSPQHHFFSVKKKSGAGFALVEMLVYIALLTIISTSSIALLFSLDDMFAENRANQLVTRGGTIAMERMLYDIRSADIVDTFNSTLQSTPGVLTLTRGTTTTEFSKVNGAVNVEVNNVTVGPLTNSSVSVDELRFFMYSNLVTEAVRIKLTLSVTVGETTVTETFYGGTVLRGSYE